MSESAQTERWGDKTITRRDVLRGIGAVAGIIAGGQVSDVLVNQVMDNRVRGPHWPVEQWIRLPQPEAAKIPWRTFKGDKGWMGRLRLTGTTYDAGILLVPHANLDAQAAQLPETAQPAVVWHPGGDQIELATVPWDMISSPTFPDKYSIGMGVNAGELQATWGMYVPEIRSITFVEGVTDTGTVRTYDMPQKMPEVYWV